MRFRAAALIFLVLAAACQQNEQADAMGDVSEKASGIDPASTTELRNAWIAAAERDDAAAVASMYTEDAVFLTGDGTVYNGRAAIQQTLAESFKMASGLTATEETWETTGDVAYSTGTWQQQMTTPDGKTVDTTGRYLVISQMQPDGTVKVARHVSIVDAPKPAGN